MKKTPNIDDETFVHIRRINGFVEEIAQYAEPENWPLSQAEQSSFVRFTIKRALQLTNSKENAAFNLKRVLSEIKKV